MDHSKSCQPIDASSKLPIYLNSSAIADETSGKANNERLTYADGALQAPRQTKDEGVEVFQPVEEVEEHLELFQEARNFV